MWKHKLGVNIFEAFGAAPAERARVLAEAGFDAFFPLWKPGEDLAAYAAAARDFGMEIPFVHAPFHRVAEIWNAADDTARDAIAEQVECLRDCAANGIGAMVAHAYIGFEDHSPTARGLDRFAGIVREASRLGVKIAFENTEGEEYLAALLDAFAGERAVGFCWDSGHEMCYNHAQDLLAKWGNRLLATHLNDNLGIRDFGGKITWRDDLHLLPFDGVADWKANAARLDRCGFDGVMMFELNVASKPGRHENDAYAVLPPAVYLAEAYGRACRVASLRA